MPTKPPPEHPEVDDALLKLLEFGPMTPFKIGQLFNIGKDGAFSVLARMKSGGLIVWRGVDESAELKERTALKDPNPFPPPWWHTPDVGFFG